MRLANLRELSFAIVRATQYFSSISNLGLRLHTLHPHLNIVLRVKCYLLDDRRDSFVTYVVRALKFVDLEVIYR